MKNILKIKGIILLSALIFAGACTSDFEDINTNPNVPVEAPASNILAHALRHVSDNVWDDWFSMNNTGSYAGMVTKIQYIDEARYDERASIVNMRWQVIYNNLLDMQKLKEIARAEGNTNMEAVGLTYEAFIWQIATDTWRDIPFFDALNAEGGVSNPTYSTQENIYPALIDSLAKAANLFANGTGSLGSGDVLYGGSAAGWEKFCNSLRMRIAIRLIDVSPTTSSAIFTAIGSSPIMTDNADNAQLMWPGAAPYKEPWAENSEGRDDHGMCEVIIDKLEELNDPRLSVIAKANSDGDYIGIPPGAIDGTFSVPAVSRIGGYYRDNFSGYTFYMRYPEVCFIKAEAIAKGAMAGSAADAIAAYEAGVKASLLEHSTAGNAGDTYGADIDAADMNAYLAQPDVAFNGTLADIDKVHIQKWISLFKQSHEAWAETRRTDVPDVPISPAYLKDNTAHNCQPFRWLYPVDEQNLNSVNIASSLANVTDGFWGQKMYWDTRTGVQ